MTKYRLTNEILKINAIFTMPRGSEKDAKRLDTHDARRHIVPGLLVGFSMNFRRIVDSGSHIPCVRGEQVAEFDSLYRYEENICI